MTVHCVGSGSCHNGCILNVFDQVVHCGPLFFSASSATGSVLNWRIGRKEVGGRFCFSIVDVSAWETDGTGSSYIHTISVLWILHWLHGCYFFGYRRNFCTKYFHCFPFYFSKVNLQRNVSQKVATMSGIRNDQKKRQKNF